MIDANLDMTIFYIALVVFFICPIALVVAAIIVDQRSTDQYKLGNGPGATRRDLSSPPVARRVSGPVVHWSSVLWRRILHKLI